MLIISKQHDYYDSVVKTTGVDKTVVYERKRSVKAISYDELDSVIPRYTRSITRPGHWGTEQTASWLHAVVFCGKTHPFIELNNVGDQKAMCFFDKDKIREEYEKKFTNTGLGKRWEDKELAKEWDALIAAKNKDQTEMCIKYQAPILLFLRFGSYPYGSNHPQMVINPELSIIGFEREKDPFTAFQEIYMFVSGVLTRPMKEPQPITDVQRAQSAGFDKKISFRREAHQRKVKK